MIDARELRVGNTLHYKTSEGEILPTTIDWQDLKWISEEPDQFNAVHSAIELTVRIILDCGFNTNYINGYIGIDVNNSDFVLTLPFVIGEWQEEYLFQFTSGNVPKFKGLKYLHQLQNLFFALTGTEL